MRGRILLVTQWYDPEPVMKGQVFARALVQEGFDVEVVTGFPNYPSGKIYDGYKLKLFQREEIDGVRVMRLPLYPSHNQRKAARVFNYASFAFSVFFYCLFFARRIDVVYSYHPPLTTPLAVLAAKFIRRFPVVVDIQDIWPDTLASTGMISSRRFLKLVGALCNFCYRFVDHIVVLSPGFKTLLQSRGVAADKISVIYNWCDEEALASAPQAPQNLPETEGKFVLLFAGNIGRAQKLDAVLETAVKTHDADLADVDFWFLGAGLDVERLKARTQELELENVKFLPAVPMEEVAHYLNAADALLVHLKDDPLFKVTIPSKIQAYLATGKPVLAAVGGDANALVTQSGAGVTALPETSASLFEAVRQLRDMTPEARAQMGQRGQDFYRAELSVEKGVKKFGNLLDRFNRRA